MMDAKLTGEARLSGAKVVLAGDDRQLGSIERGGLFTELKKEHGSVEIREVTRQKVDWQREAAHDLSDGRFEEALRLLLATSPSSGHQSGTSCAESLSSDGRRIPHRRAFVFAYTNKDVDALNKDLRAVRRARGELGEDFVFTTKHGEAPFAVGDRIQFTDTLKGAGIYNGNAGVITRIDRDSGRIGVTLDSAAGREGRKVEWYASEFSGFRHGYAGTIYKGQGKTLDHTYLMQRLARNRDVAALIVEPLVLGAGGMLMYPAWVLTELKRIAERSGTLFIADEVMTGWGRTGTIFACDQAAIAPDILCTSKGLTGGSLPLAATLATDAIFRAHYSKDRARTFFHSSSYTANPIACAAALANVGIRYDEPVAERVAALSRMQTEKIARFSQDPRFENVRTTGTIAALDLRVGNAGYLAEVGPRLRAFFLERGLLVRPPLGNVIYVLLPYCVTSDELDRLYAAIDEAAELASDVR
ncbi:aminotransferase class III-fold pyridoxal phosphate-dependent enzyme [Mesorhizobium sp.]|uniref:aminotransferase class III-fold pyridoxal phosphate-dependent enzyme n=1 Tax=Mesorhizobium sp. TaxID=1871066 RepID=UPI000FE60BF6|nr:aminotransferase class III-fold pyridoxal phosphate-dependent enzyme [Mesorhizobium sp.]RWE35169.1 MAG: aminotransferase class III-fold pyridoxal phosphate-dependent enzyme [Mesorhizobium sp.]